MSGSNDALGDTDAQTREFLLRFGFDAERLAELRARLHASAARADNHVVGELEPVDAEALRALPNPGSEEHRELTEAGEAAIRAGRVGVLMLAGGMATRFGAVVKALAEAYDGKSFLDLKLEDAARVASRLDARVPVLIMSSFATDEALRAALGDTNVALPIEVFAQEVSLRLTPDGALHRDAGGALSPYATGHGDLTFALRRSGALRRFVDAGGELLLMSNVDNLVATLDPAVIGAHLVGGKVVTAEVAPKVPGDQGGIPLSVDGVPQVVEGFRLPPGFDQDSVPVFNTNTMVLDARAIDRDFELDWFVVNKKVDGAPVVQFERLVGQVTAHLPTQFLQVPRDGSRCRFAPIKVPEDLERQRELIAAVLRG
ncbi:MAG: UTP--glucose-1-phosphate uridylyltransferase [Sandaracinaceae bacterium]|nr:UTP--glucose-1-phosphate uridylyltransferase [Sandaracinaceae bacterium]